MTKHPSRKRLVRMADDLPANHWMRRQLPLGASLRRYNEDRAVSMLTRAVDQAINDAGLARADVASVLGTTKSYVSQVLNGSTNMTLKTLGALLWAAGQQVVELRLEPLGTEEQRRSTAIPHFAFQTSSTGSENLTYKPGTVPYIYRMGAEANTARV